MEPLPMNFSGDFKHRIGNPRRSFSNFNNFNNSRSLVSYASDDFSHANFFAGGSGGVPYMLPPPLFQSFPPSISVFRPRQQPPLLPLPISKPPVHQNMNHNNNNNSRLSSPPINKKIKNNRSRDQSLTPKKSQNQKDSKKEKGNILPPTSTEAAASKKSSAMNRMGPDPTDLPKDFTARVLSSPINDFSDVISGSVVFTTSPPPSSLPLPTFSLRPKLRCNAAAAVVDAGATDDLRRVLRLR